MVHHSTNKLHRSHFWMPDFFAHAFGKRKPETPMDGRIVRHSNNILNTGMLGETAIQHIRYGDTMNRVETGELSGAALLGWIVASKGEHDLEPDKKANPRDKYRTCLLSYGLDSPICKNWLMATINDGDAQYQFQTDVLGEKASGSGVCQGVGLRSDLCQGFCADTRSMERKLCEQSLRNHCKEQTAAFGHEEICPCWLQPEVYDEMQSKIKDESTKSLTAEQAEEIQKTLKLSQAKASCWYGPCTVSRVRPVENCPNTNIFTCMQDMSKNIMESGGSQTHSQSCTFAVNSGGTPNSAPTTNQPPPTTNQPSPTGDENTNPPPPFVITLLPGVENATIVVVVVVSIVILILLVIMKR